MPSAQLLFISPHLDDAVFACGQTLAAHPGSMVLTVFAGAPRPGLALTAWDRDAGFGPGEDVMQRRRREDDAALAQLAARALRLDFRDRQYLDPEESERPESIECELAALLRTLGPLRMLAPLGLFHSDHVLASDAALGACARVPGIDCVAYEDALYRALPGLVQLRLRELALRQWSATPIALPAGPMQDKRNAVACYASQLRALATGGRLGHGDAFASERYWRLSRNL